MWAHITSFTFYRLLLEHWACPPLFRGCIPYQDVHIVSWSQEIVLRGPRGSGPLCRTGDPMHARLHSRGSYGYFRHRILVPHNLSDPQKHMTIELRGAHVRVSIIPISKFYFLKSSTNEKILGHFTPFKLCIKRGTVFCFLPALSPGSLCCLLLNG